MFFFFGLTWSRWKVVPLFFFFFSYKGRGALLPTIAEVVDLVGISVNQVTGVLSICFHLLLLLFFATY